MSTIDNDMKLPIGKTCADCRWYERCKWLISCDPANITCDWAPSRFKQKVTEETRGAIFCATKER